eukprot:5354212-Prymnesium_polylepis.3
MKRSRGSACAYTDIRLAATEVAAIIYSGVASSLSLSAQLRLRPVVDRWSTKVVLTAKLLCHDRLPSELCPDDEHGGEARDVQRLRGHL